MLRVLAREPLAWALAAFYFLTFGGFVAFSIYLPTLLRDQFGLRPADAGFRTAGFVVLATLCRPVGGWLSDKIGGSRVLSWILPAVAVFGLLLGVQSMVPFTVGALGCAALLGIGNGAIFQLVPRYFPTQRATVTGLVGHETRPEAKAELRRSAGDLHVRNHFRDLWRHLPLFHLDSKTSHLCVLEARVAVV